MKKSNEKKMWALAGLWVMCLVLTLPFYSAHALATTVTISQNHGLDAVPDYIDAGGDTWTVEATVSNYDGEGSLSASQVLLDVSGSELPFDSCSGDTLSTRCTFESDLSDGILEGEYPFTVSVYDPALVSVDAQVGGVVYADGSVPSVSLTYLEQIGSEVRLDFTASELPLDACSGFESLRIIDADTDEILETITFDEPGDCEYFYEIDSPGMGVLQVELEGEGLRRLEVEATDFLGHSDISSSRSFESDFVAPSIVFGSMELVEFGDYIGDFSAPSDVVVNVTECEELVEVAATSEQIDFASQPGNCVLEDSLSCTWTCEWNSLTVSPDGSSVSAEFVAIDGKENVGTAILTQGFSVDSAAPQVTSFGTENTFQGASYVAAGEENLIVLELTDTGAGIALDGSGVAANLLAVGGGDWQVPDSCVEGDAGKFTCEWLVSTRSSSSTTSDTISLRQLDDVVGNMGDLESAEVLIDGIAPIVRSIDFSAFSVLGEKEFFQSNDDVLVTLEVEEAAGLEIFVDARELVMDAETKYRYGEYVDTEYIADERDGFAHFSEADCSREAGDGNWLCELRVDSIKSGYDPAAEFSVEVFDTAGNLASCASSSLESDATTVAGQNCEYSMEIFAVDEETQPDFWEVSSLSDGDSFVNLDISQLTSPRVNYDIRLSSDIAAEAALIEVGECVSNETGAPVVGRSILFGGANAGANPSLNMILEYDPFDPASVFDVGTLEGGEEFSGEVFEYTCQMDVYSIVGDTAMSFAEKQEVVLPVLFAYSELGALDENIDDLIYQEISKGSFRTFKVINDIAKVLRWGELLLVAINVFNFLFQTIAGINAAVEPLQNLPTTKPAATGVCFGGEGAKSGASTVLPQITGFLQVFYCHPGDTEFGSGSIGGVMNGWQQWQKTVLELWSTLKGEWVYDLAFGNKGPTGEKADPGFLDDPSFGSDEQSKQFWYNQLSSRGTAASLYDNIYVGAIGLCIPSVMYNIQKLYQAHCTKLACLKNDVPAGQATVQSCFEVQEYLVCKYVLGEVVAQIMPLTQLDRLLGDLLKSIIFDPVGTIMSIISITCSTICATSNTGVNVCTAITWLLDAVSMAGSIANVIKGIPTIQYDICKEAGVETVLKNYEQYEAEQVAAGESSSVTTQDIAAEGSGVEGASA